MEPAELVVLRKVNSRFEADVIAASLESGGIRALVRSDDIGGMVPEMALLRGAEVLVHRTDEEEARQLLA